MRGKRRAVVFDLYGTIVHVQVDEQSPCFWNALASDFFAFKKDFSGDVLRSIYTRLIEMEEKDKDEGFLLDAVFFRLLKELEINPTHENINQFAHKFRKHSIVSLSKKTYTDLLLRKIRASGYKLGLLSNTEELLTKYDLQALSLEHKFDEIILSSSRGIKKPDKRIFDEILQRLGVNNKETVFVGDNFENDIVGALNSDIDAVFLTESERVSSACKTRYGAKIVCASFDLKEINNALEKLSFNLSQPAA